MRPRALPLSRVYRLLEPGPVVLVTTACRGRANVMAMSWHTMLEFEPPLVGCVISNRNYTFDVLKSTRECVIAIPTVEIARKAVACGNVSGRKVDKFARLGLTPLAASKVRAPFVAECYANLAWIDPARKDPRTIHHRGMGRFMLAGPTVRLPSKAR